MATILIGGGSGLIGQRLSVMLMDKGHDVIILTRKSRTSSNPRLSYAVWDTSQNTIDINAVAKSDYIINLAGEGIADKRWSKKRKLALLESRTKSCALLVHTLSNNANKIKAVINASAMGWYGKDEVGSVPYTEDAPAANDFLGETCKAWEESIDPVASLGKRLVKIRVGLVLSKDGGALKEFIKPVKFGIAAVLGSGNQAQSWIHIDDICRMFIYAIENESLSGVYNGVAPKPVSNKTLVKTIAKKLKGSFYITMHVPSFVLKIMVGELSSELLNGLTVSSTKIKDSGFQFVYPSIEAAVNDLV